MTMPERTASGLPEAQGLYDPRWEHDACGLGFVANLDGRASHDIVRMGIDVLINLTHRGASGCDPETGDGAGLLVQLPHAFFRRQCSDLGFELPAPGQYGAGLVVLPVEKQERLTCEGVLERIVGEEGLTVLGWRDTPVDATAIGRVARGSQPYIEQLFVGAAPGMAEDVLERKLYVVRRRAENEIAASKLHHKDLFYIPSLSSRTIVYKGLLLAPQIARFFKDLADPEMVSALCVVHQRFSTNTFPTWPLAHPFRFIAHNGEINTLRGNVNWMNARQSVLASPLLGEDLKKLLPIVVPGGSDSASFDNVVELLLHAGRSLPHVMAMLIPEAWAGNQHMDPDRRAFYEYHASLMEPWDGPAAMVFTDGRQVGAMLDRNGLRPGRYAITHDGMVVMASEAGVLPLDPKDVKMRGRLQPGKMLLVDTTAGRLVPDKEIKRALAAREPYAAWLQENLITLEQLPPSPRVHGFDHSTLVSRQRAFGYTDEDVEMVLGPMASRGEEPVGSMGNDAPLPCLSERAQPLFHYFRQLFAQVTNPPIDPIREQMVMSLVSYIGREGNILDETPQNCHTLKLPHPILTNAELEKLRRVSRGDLLACTLPALFRVGEGAAGLERAVEELCRRASLAVQSGYTLLILSDRGLDEEYAPIPSLLALAAVHNLLIRECTRNQVALIVESGEPREVMHFALLLGYGASAVNPYLAFETVEDLCRRGQAPAEISSEAAARNLVAAINKGLLKTISKMGISTLQSYCGAQVFEAIGVNRAVIDKYFTGTPSRIEGVGLEVLAREAQMKHAFAFQPIEGPELVVGGQYKHRSRGEHHLFNPSTVSKLQQAVRRSNFTSFQEFAELIDGENRRLCTLRGLLDIRASAHPVPLEEVEPAKEIVRRFCTGAMSFGAISKEAHETLALAMNRIGGRSNSGEGGEDPERYKAGGGESKRSAVKQVASARFGVTTEYLVNAEELQIKMAQGAKPGEGGQLPGIKVDEEIARVRHSTPGVALISPPPHHDIYSIEDLAQLIFDLKCVNPAARISVKLVAEVGVGTVAAGVAKADADVILISGDSGGTGAAPLGSIRHTGIPWEMGLAEAHQVLLLNDLRGRVRLQTDGKLQTGRDVVIAALLGAEEFGFATAPLVALGCVMVRQCHLNTCPVGIATQDPALRKRFKGEPEHLVNYFFFVAEQVRAWMAQMGFRSFDEMVGRVDMLETRSAAEHWKAKGIDLSSVLYAPPVPARVARRCVRTPGAEPAASLDDILSSLEPALAGNVPAQVSRSIRNVHRSVGARLSGEIARRHGAQGLPDDTIRCEFTGAAGQSFGAFAARGLTLALEGEANDYVGKGLSGGKLIIRPPRDSSFLPEHSVLVGNVALYGATSGLAFLNGVAGERFAVRNSGAIAVVEGVGDHACEYMTRGVVVVLGRCGRNFAAGMTGGLAYVLDEEGIFAGERCNLASVDLDPVFDDKDAESLRHLIAQHRDATESPRAGWILENWGEMLPRFIKVFPREYKRVLGIAPSSAVYIPGGLLPRVRLSHESRLD